jgi:ferrous iron transport protein B
MSEQVAPQRPLRVGLVGNPNSGKSTIFNQLTGLRQKTGNFPGVTVEVKEGRFLLNDGREVLLTDFPGAYSLYPTASDERVVASVLTNPEHPHFPDVLVYVADSTHLEKHLLLFSQILDLQLPVLLALNMSDLAEEQGVRINVARLAQQFCVPVLPVSGRLGTHMDRLKQEIGTLFQDTQYPQSGDVLRVEFYPMSEVERQVADAVRYNLMVSNPYRALLLAHHHTWLPHLPTTERDTLAAIVDTKGFQSLRMQVEETLDRYDRFTPLVQEAVARPSSFPVTTTDRLDAILTHRVGGPFIFFGVMLLVFLVVFYGYETTGGWVESGMDWLIDQAKTLLVGTRIERLTDFLTKGVLEGFKGVLVFVPQIALLSFLIAVLEECGYLARAVFMFDKSMRRYGMNGRSIVALIGGGACAVPSIKGTRTISNWKERMITIMVTPFISCSARIPVYMVLIPVALPRANWWTWAAVFGAMYLLGIVAALASGWVLKKLFKSREASFLALEMPVYRTPHWRNVWLTVWDKTMNFVTGVWKPILIITSVLWFLSSFGPGDIETRATQKAEQVLVEKNLPESEREDLVAAYRLEYSWAGEFGRKTEFIIRPLGYDWKIGIGILSSFLAREVFNSTMYIIYSLESKGKEEDEAAADQKPFERYSLLRQRMSEDTFTKGGNDLVYTTPTGISLLVFYALAMQCMSTLVVVKQETGRWRWAVLQFLFMGGLAYVLAWVAYTVTSAWL